MTRFASQEPGALDKLRQFAEEIGARARPAAGTGGTLPAPREREPTGMTVRAKAARPQRRS
jgi:hypothetical protein